MKKKVTIVFIISFLLSSCVGNEISETPDAVQNVTERQTESSEQEEATIGTIKKEEHLKLIVGFINEMYTASDADLEAYDKVRQENFNDDVAPNVDEDFVGIDESDERIFEYTEYLNQTYMKYADASVLEQLIANRTATQVVDIKAKLGIDTVVESYEVEFIDDQNLFVYTVELNFVDGGGGLIEHVSCLGKLRIDEKITWCDLERIPVLFVFDEAGAVDSGNTGDTDTKTVENSGYEAFEADMSAAESIDDLVKLSFKYTIDGAYAEDYSIKTLEMYEMLGLSEFIYECCQYGEVIQNDFAMHLAYAIDYDQEKKVFLIEALAGTVRTDENRHFINILEKHLTSW